MKIPNWVCHGAAHFLKSATWVAALVGLVVLGAALINVIGPAAFILVAGLVILAVRSFWITYLAEKERD